MRRLSVVVLSAVAVLLVCVDTSTASAVTSPTYPTAEQSFDLESGTRLLRRNDDIDEERAGALDKVTELTKAGASKVKEGLTKAHEVGMLQTYLQSADDGKQVLNKLKLGDNIADTLANPKLGLLSEYVTMFNNKYPKSRISVTGALSAKYGDEVVAMAIVNAQKSTRSTKFRKEMWALRKEQMRDWFKGGRSADDVFDLLKLREEGYKALATRKLEVLEDYIKFANKKKNPQHSDLINTLTKGFRGESNLVTILRSAKSDQRALKKANEMEAMLFKKWLAKDELPESVFKKLKLDGNLLIAFRPTYLNAIAKYVANFNQKNPTNQASTIKILTASYKEEDIAKALYFRIGERGDKLAKTLLREQMLSWFSSGKSVDDVYAILRLQQEGAAAINSWKVDVLTAYIKLLNRGRTGRTLIKTLAKHYDGDVNLAMTLERATANPVTAERATRLQEKQFKMWVEDGVKPKTLLSSVFKVNRATDEQNAIAAKFKTYYDSYAKVPAAFLIPRRS